MQRIILSLLLMISVSNLSAQQITDFSANYLVRYNNIQAAELKQTLETQADGTRLYTSTMKAKGVFSYIKPDIITETSLWHLQNGEIQPLNYSYRRTGGKKEKQLTMRFDWTAMAVDIDDKKHPWQLDLRPKTLDKLVYQIALMQDLNEGKQHFDYTIADGGKLKTYNIGMIGEEVIETPLGKIETIKFTRIKNIDKKRKTTLWCAPALNYLPVKIEHVEKHGTTYTAFLRRLKGIDKTNAFKRKIQKPAFR
jgi:hypothetical protein